MAASLETEMHCNDRFSLPARAFTFGAMRSDVEIVSDGYLQALSHSGPTLAAVGWPNPSALGERFEILLSPLGLQSLPPGKKIKLLDMGCAFALLLDYLAENGLEDRIDYYGVDLFEQTLDVARARWPTHHFEVRDVRDRPFPPNAFDYCVLSGTLHERDGLTYRQMEQMAKETLRALWPSVTIGLGFTAISKHVEQERENLFHWPLDDIMAFCKADLSRHVALHIDSGLWETAALVFKEPRKRAGAVPAQWSKKLYGAQDSPQG